MKKITPLLTILFFSLNMQCASAALIVTPTSTGTTLVNSILGSGVSFSNINYIGAANQAGTFTGGTSAGLGFNTGIILTTGDARLAASNPDNLASVTTDTGGDPALTALAGNDTFDKNILSFDFSFDSGTGGDLFFNFIFASEEYPDFVGSVNDAFAIFVNGANVALIPGTSTPVTINNVNADTNSSFFNENTGQFANVYGGFTKSMTASSLGLGPGTHNVTFAIADAFDASLDSAVFIQAGSFGSTPAGVGAPIPEPGTWAAAALLVTGAAYARWRKRKTA